MGEANRRWIAFISKNLDSRCLALVTYHTAFIHLCQVVPSSGLAANRSACASEDVASEARWVDPLAVPRSVTLCRQRLGLADGFEHLRKPLLGDVERLVSFDPGKLDDAHLAAMIFV